MQSRVLLIITKLPSSITQIIHRHPTVRILFQPPQSPDCNPLGQGIFVILDDAVENENQTTRDQLHETVVCPWNLLSEHKIRSHISKQIAVRAKIIAARGGNKFTSNICNHL